MIHRNRFLTSLRNRLYFLLLTVLIPVLLLQAGYCYNRYQARRQNEFQASLEVARAVGETYDEFVRSILHQELAIGINLTVPQEIPVEQMNEILEANRVEHPAIRDISWIDPEGRIVASSMTRMVGENVGDRAHIGEIVGGREWVLSDLLLSRSTGEPIVSISRGIRDKEGKLRGIVATALVADKLGEMLAVELSKEGTITLVDRTGRAVSQHPRQEWAWEQRDLVEKRPALRDALNGKEVVGIFPCFVSGEARMAALTRAKMSEWVISSGRLEKAVMAPIRSEIIRQVGLSLVITIVVLLVAVAISRNITAPIKKLQEHALALGHGNLKHQIEVHGSTELRDLALAFNTMAEMIRRREESLRLDEARFESLYGLSQMTEESQGEIEDFVLEQEVKITRSEIGFISLLTEDETGCKTFVCSKGAARECAAPEGWTHGRISEAGVWAEAVRKREPVLINDCAGSALSRNGCPGGHVPLKRLMVVPVFDGNRIAAVAGVGNKESEYNYSDVRQLTLLMDGMWKHVQRKKAEKALRETESLAAIGRAMSAVAHDMRTPLVAIGGFTRLVQRHLDEGNPDRGRLGIVVEETQRLEKMVRDMLDFSRPLRLQRAEGDIRWLIAECLPVVEGMARQKGVSLLDQSTEEAVSISFDSDRMKQVIINLLANAIQASPKGEEVVIRSGLNGDGLLAIDVIDRGCGIACNDRKDIFSPFFTTKKEGTGLGLPIVKKIVEAHRGKVEVIDNPERGVTFRTLIPLDQG